MFVQKTRLESALAAVKKSVPPRPTLEVLSCVNLYADDENILRVRGTDLETYTEASIPCAESDNEDVCVAFSVFRDAVAGLDDEKIGIEVGASSLKLYQGSTKLEFPTIPGKEFPLAPPPVEDGTFYMDSDALDLAFGRVLHAASTDAARPILTGVLVSMVGGMLTTVAADGFRMGVSNIKIEDEREYRCVIPAKSAGIVLGALAEGEVVVMPDTMRIGFVLPEKDGVFVKIYCQLIEGNFVNYTQIIPTAEVVPFLVEKEDLVKSLQLGRVFAKGNANIVSHVISEDTLSLHAHSIEDGEFDKAINGSYDGEYVEFGMNYAYELDALKVMGDVVAVECQTSNRPIVIYTEGQKENFLCVLMPMHIRK